MPIRCRQLAIVLAVALTAGGLGGCGTINGYLAAGASDYIPQWAGGMPADAPPRPGTAKYDEYMKEREQKRLEPAPAKDAAGQPSSGPDAVH
ncbi:MAG: hypothetical protein JWP25_7621 [Bradyrhizobium sp.]|jgi:hypothetical protein|nr:hypothetical protein [Bradyrhizobium sp.]